MRPFPVFLIVLVALDLGCGGRAPDPYDLNFDIPRSETFAATLSAYGLYREPLSDRRPAEDVRLYELSSELFTDYARKQRLLRLPEGTAISAVGERLVFPEGTVMAKTFFYPVDMRRPEGPERVIETRLLVKRDGVWNVATYLWDEAQSEANLLLDGTKTVVSWRDASGQSRSTEYVVPHEGECVTCHQVGGGAAFIGPSLQNLNRTVTRDGTTSNQMAYLAQAGWIADADWGRAPSIPDYRSDRPLAERARAYLDVNCAHCHNPSGWEESSERNLDFRYRTPLDQTGLVRRLRDVRRQLENGDMPYLGTTLLHDEGVGLVLEYLETL